MWWTQRHIWIKFFLLLTTLFWLIFKKYFYFVAFKFTKQIRKELKTIKDTSRITPKRYDLFSECYVTTLFLPCLTVWLRRSSPPSYFNKMDLQFSWLSEKKLLFFSLSQLSWVSFFLFTGLSWNSCMVSLGLLVFGHVTIQSISTKWKWSGPLLGLSFLEFCDIFIWGHTLITSEHKFTFLVRKHTTFGNKWE